MLSSSTTFPSLRLVPTSATSRRSIATPVTIWDRSKNRKPSQHGCYLSTEAVQSLKRATLCGAPAAGAIATDPKMRRLLKANMVAVFSELAAQGEALVALKVFEEIRKEHWYKPRLFWYVDLITVLASKGLRSHLYNPIVPQSHLEEIRKEDCEVFFMYNPIVPQSHLYN